MPSPFLPFLKKKKKETDNKEKSYETLKTPQMTK